ncbi:MAG: hypothetical protein HC768_19185 [Acaryochloris sp. CRU_2_0]|nr:hypothetical protein [Acaryochloris sp. CRU_2_0]
MTGEVLKIEHLIAQNALKASHSKAEVEFILLSHNPTLQGIMTEQGQDKAKKAAAIIVRGAQIKNLTVEDLEQEQGIQTPDQDGGSSL